jgi:hypothetical protein
MRPFLGQTIIIENVTGANGNLGIGRVAHAKPDGYTLAFSVSSSTHVINGAIYALTYDVVNDFCTHCAGCRQSDFDSRQENHAGERSEGIDRVAQGKP